MIQLPAISGYGILVSLGFITAYCVTLVLAKKTDCVLVSHIDRLLLWALIPAIVGARVLFIFYHLDYFSMHPDEMIAVWRGGWVWHGALIGGLIGVWLYCRRVGISFLQILDLLVPGAALGQAIGRWGNFLNQEAYGLPTGVPWAIAIDPERRLAGYESFATFHPTFFYESLLDAGLFLFLGWLLLRTGHTLSSRAQREIPVVAAIAGSLGKLGMTQRHSPSRRSVLAQSDGASKDERGDDRHADSSTSSDGCRTPVGLTSGMVFFLYLFLYSLERFWIEFLRIDAVPVLGPLRAPQWISLVLMVIGLFGLIQVLRKQKKVVY